MSRLIKKAMQEHQGTPDEVKAYLEAHVDDVQRAAKRVAMAVDNLNTAMNEGFNDNVGFVDEFLDFDLVKDTSDFKRNMYFGMIGNNEYSCSQENLIGVDKAINAAMKALDALTAFKQTYTKRGDEYAQLDKAGFFNGMTEEE